MDTNKWRERLFREEEARRHAQEQADRQRQEAHTRKAASVRKIILATDCLLKMPLSSTERKFATDMRRKFASALPFRPSVKQWSWFRRLHKRFEEPIVAMLKKQPRNLLQE